MYNENDLLRPEEKKVPDRFKKLSDKQLFMRQGLVSFGTFMLNLAVGANTGFSAILIPQLKDEGIELSTELMSWVAAISSLPLFLGNIVSGYIMEKFGRRSAQIMLAVPFVIGWVIIGITSNIHLILVGRFITGFCQGCVGPLGPVFVGEVSSPAYRGFFLASMSLAIAIGVLLSHLLGTFWNWKYVSFICGTCPVIAFFIIMNSPESPSWLASQGYIERCTESFYWYRGRSPQSKAELDNMIDGQTKKPKPTTKLVAFKENIKKPEFWKPLGIMVTFFIITQLTGVNVLCAYTTIMVIQLVSSDISPFVVMIGIDILRCMALAVACVVLRVKGRRPMALISGCLTSLSLLLLALYLFLHKIGKIEHISSFITLSLMSTYIVVSNMGIIPLPWNMVGEVFPIATRGLGSGISVMVTSIAFFATIKSAPMLFDYIGFYGTYLIYGVSTLLGTIFLSIFLPETKGKTLQEVEEYFKPENKLNTNVELKKLQEA